MSVRPACPDGKEGTIMSTLIIFVILTLATIGVLVWAVIEDDRDERGRK